MYQENPMLPYLEEGNGSVALALGALGLGLAYTSPLKYDLQTYMSEPATKAKIAKIEQLPETMVTKLVRLKDGTVKVVKKVTKDGAKSFPKVIAKVK